MHIGSHAATCREPLPPQNGSVDDRSSTNDGYMVVYYCNPGFLPDVQMIAVCSTANGIWVPQPADLVCTKQSHDLPGNSMGSCCIKVSAMRRVLVLKVNSRRFKETLNIVNLLALLFITFFSLAAFPYDIRIIRCSWVFFCELP